MCLTLPMRVLSIDGFSARCEARGAQRDVSLWLLQHEDLAPGDVVMVHLDRAIAKASPEQAAAAWALVDEILAVLDTPGSPRS